jgi:L,D-peptidoglycan transpeptidase YkuD (ErfK/YbiS/YcfS/YnhG family)
MTTKRTPWLATIVAAALALTVSTLVGTTHPTNADAATRPLPERLSNIGTARQVIVVTTPSWGSSHARLQTWRQANDGTWVRLIDPIPARVGWNGVRRAKNRLQNTGTTPAGTFALHRGFGLAGPSGVQIPYRQVDANDWWPYDPNDPKTYNVLQPHRVHRAHWRTDWAERLKSYRKQYRYAVILDYNLPSDIHWRNGQRIAKTTANIAAGGGIFLHVNGSGATAGCVSIARPRMLRVLRWLDPEKNPVIVIGPREVIERM